MNLDFYTKSQIDEKLGGLKFTKLTKAEYDAITPDADTVYFVIDGTKVTQYFGDAKLTGGTSSGAVVYVTQNIPSFIGNVEEV